ncbi:MAG: cation:proton antiporter [Neisseriaceae bacterium]
MNHFFTSYPQLAWPFTILTAWLLGEIGAYFTKVPRISFYIILGFIVEKLKIDVLHSPENLWIINLVNIIAGMMLFEFGYRINLNWIKNNPIIIVMGIIESIVTFFSVYLLSIRFNISNMTSLEFSALSMASSPFVIIYLIRQQHGSGQVTERILHLTFLNTILAVSMFKLILGLIVFNKLGDAWQAVFSSLITILLSVMLGILMTLFLHLIIKRLSRIPQNIPIAISLIIIFMVAITKSFELSTIIAALTFGLASRYINLEKAVELENVCNQLIIKRNYKIKHSPIW